MRQFILGSALLALAGPSAMAGVVVQMEVTGPALSKKAGEEILYAQGTMARMDPRAGRGDKEMSVIFRDQTMWFVDHDDKVCRKIDEEGMAALSAQMGAALKQLESLPPEQRAMMEKMMRGKMPGMGEAPPRRMETGGSDRVGEYACTVHTLHAGDRKVWEVCAADKGILGDAEEAMEAFRAMSRFSEKLQEAVRQGPFAAMMETPYNDLDDLEGFPVRVRTYDRGGKMVHESVLKSVTRRDLDPGIFQVPDGYEVKDLKDEIKGGR